MRTILLFILFTATITDALASEYAKAEATLEGLFPPDTHLDIRPSAVPDVLEVRSGLQVLYITTDGEFVFNGPLFAMDQKKNLSEVRLAEYRRELLDDVSALDTIEYPAPNGTQAITVITDIDCPYCRRLHQDMNSYHAAGIDISYVMLPRAGKGSESYQKTRHAMCAEQPAIAITSAMNGQTPAAAECDDVLDQHMDMALRLGVGSTPNILLPDGTLIPGYKSAGELALLLNP